MTSSALDSFYVEAKGKNKVHDVHARSSLMSSVFKWKVIVHAFLRKKVWFLFSSIKECLWSKCDAHTILEHIRNTLLFWLRNLLDAMLLKPVCIENMKN